MACSPRRNTRTDVGQHWRVTLRLIVIRGAETDFLGQYRRNSFGGTQVRYSF